ncbi:GSCFA domain-containing protein [Halovulum sp. GXIMD14793]
MTHPYSDLPKKAFWKPAVGDRYAEHIDQLWNPRFRFTRSNRVVTFGSCFAQHFSRALIEHGFHWLNAEKAPSFVSESTARDFGYGVFSARTGNIYTAADLLQWLRAASGQQAFPEDEVWEKDGRFYDPFRPAIEPDGFASVEELLESRAVCVEAFGRAVTDCDRFVFTMGLTEGWVNSETSVSYAICPGTVAGHFDAEMHKFKNYSFMELNSAMRSAINILRQQNPRVRILLTVSPVPLTATASDEHVLVATMYSKSLLRAVCGSLQKQYGIVDYFPSYEIISAPAFGGRFFMPNMRSVAPEGVAFVMKSFFDA